MTAGWRVLRMTTLSRGGEEGVDVVKIGGGPHEVFRDAGVSGTTAE
jgi:hypothetical protein